MSDQSARAAAQKAGRDTYSQEVIEHWPACVVCDRTIRRNIDVPGRLGLQRICDCPDVYWQMPMTGGPWERVTVGEQ